LEWLTKQDKDGDYK